eukprot:GILJ01008447.1.p1 GENE.GILJ01008447.1~~GILJ01008447.1.p1  ORF type:complete len:654 (-),score=26.09 GILJ01008447.1:91-2052(-)
MGFESELVVGDKEKWLCAICHDVVEDARETPCEHIYCRDCLTSLPRRECPSCRQSFEEIKPPHRLVREQLSNLRIRCARNQEGCQELLPLTKSAISEHETICLFMIVRCDRSSETGEQCQTILMRRDLPSHFEECLFFDVGCGNDGCDEKVVRKDCQAHALACLFEKIACVECGERFLRRHQDSHEDQCSEEHVGCAYVEQGCPVTIRRKELDAHLRTCQFAQVRCRKCDKRFPRNEETLHDCVVTLLSRLCAQMDVSVRLLAGLVGQHPPPEHTRYNDPSLYFPRLEDPVDWMSPTIRVDPDVCERMHIQTICSLLTLNGNLESLSIVDCPISTRARFLGVKDPGLKYFGPVIRDNHVTLRELMMPKQKLGFPEARMLGDMLRSCRRLQVLNLAENPLGVAGSQALIDVLGGLKLLQELNLCQTGLVPAGVESIARCLEQLSQLNTLHLSGNVIGPGGALALARSWQCQVSSNLRVLSLADNAMGPLGAQAIGSAFENLCHLERINMNANDIGHEGAQQLANNLHHLVNIQAIHLALNNLGFEGTRALAPVVGQLASLTELNLAGNDIGDSGIDLLPTLIANPSLRSLDLCVNDIRSTRVLYVLAAKSVSDVVIQLGGEKHPNPLHGMKLPPRFRYDISATVETGNNHAPLY